MPKPLNADWNLAQALYVQGVSYAAISEKVGVTLASLRQRAHRYGWRALKTESVMVVSQAVTEHNGKTLVQRSAEVRTLLADEIAGSANALREIPFKSDLPHLNERAEIASKLAGASGKVFGWSDEAPPSLILGIDLRSHRPENNEPVMQLEG